MPPLIITAAVVAAVVFIVLAVVAVMAINDSDFNSEK